MMKGGHGQQHSCNTLIRVFLTMHLMMHVHLFVVHVCVMFECMADEQMLS